MSGRAEPYEVEIERRATFFPSYRWELWRLREDGSRAYRAGLAPPLNSYGDTMTRRGARRAAKRALRLSERYYQQERERVRITVGPAPASVVPRPDERTEEE